MSSARIGKAVGGQHTHWEDPQRPGWSICGSVKGALRIEINTTRVSCSKCRRWS